MIRRRHQIQIQKVTDVRGEYNTTDPQWHTIATVPASIEPLAGRELYFARQVLPTVTHRVNCQYLRGIDSKMRIVFQGRTLEILSVVNPEERNHELVIMAIEKQ